MTGLPINKKFNTGCTFSKGSNNGNADPTPLTTTHTVSVIIPTIRSLDAINNIVSSLSFDSLLEVIIVLDRKITKYDEQQISKLDQYIIVKVTKENLGAGLARNEGIRIAQGDIILFIDDDCIPSPNWIRDHLKHYSSPDIVAVGAPIRFFDSENKNKTHVLNECSLLYSFHAPMYYDELFWNPTANLSVKTEIAKKCLFNKAFPKNGGGEDVFFGFQLSTFGKMKAEPEAWVYHPYWKGKRNISKRFIRWGYADCVLANQCYKEKELKDKLIPRELTPVSWFIMALVTGGILSFLSNNIMYSLLPLGGIISWILFEIFLWHRDKGVKHSVVEIISVLFFDFGSTVTRFHPRYWKIINQRIIFFPDQLLWLWLATSRVRNSTLLGYIIALSLIIYFS